MSSETTKIGNWGEEIATKWLRQHGYMIVARNWRAGRYELDIVAQKGFSIHFVEVKTRVKGGWTTPEDAINEKKFRSLQRAANAFLASFPTPREPQFDLIAVETSPNGEYEVRYYANAMVPHW
ncbi:MAG: YraN family protein [Rikenellaceae bacterium]